MLIMFIKIASKGRYVLLKFLFFWFVLLFVFPIFTEVGQLGDPSNIEFDVNECFSLRAINVGLIRSPAFLFVSHPLAPLIDYLSILQKCFSRAHWHTIVPLEVKNALLKSL